MEKNVKLLSRLIFYGLIITLGMFVSSKCFGQYSNKFSMSIGKKISFPVGSSYYDQIDTFLIPNCTYFNITDIVINRVTYNTSTLFPTNALNTIFLSDSLTTCVNTNNQYSYYIASSTNATSIIGLDSRFQIVGTKNKYIIKIRHYIGGAIFAANSGVYYQLTIKGTKQ